PPGHAKPRAEAGVATGGAKPPLLVPGGVGLPDIPVPRIPLPPGIPVPKVPLPAIPGSIPLPGGIGLPDIDGPLKPPISPSAVALQNAAQDGKPHCEMCEKAKQLQSLLMG